MMIPKYHLDSGEAIGALTGAEIIAIEQAERYGTDLVSMENGKIIHASPEDVRTALGYPKRGSSNP